MKSDIIKAFKIVYDNKDLLAYALGNILFLFLPYLLRVVITLSIKEKEKEV
jgi:hypothetical protein